MTCVRHANNANTLLVYPVARYANTAIEQNT